MTPCGVENCGKGCSLATLELQKHGRVGLADNLVAFWSPDGTFAHRERDTRSDG